MIHLHCVVSRLSSILATVQRLAPSPAVDITVYVRSDDDRGQADGIRVYPIAPRRRPWEAPLVSTALSWKLDGERSRLDFLLIRNAVREALEREPEAQHVLVSFHKGEFVTQRVAEDLRLPHVKCEGSEP
jgi:hypothetical protein